jgi:UDP-galactopyranose mutase
MPDDPRRVLLAQRPRAFDLPVICFSHLRWDFVFQRPHHLLSRFARDVPVLYVEEPMRSEEASPRLAIRRCERTGVCVATPMLRAGDGRDALRAALDDALADTAWDDAIAWYYTPMALPWSAHRRFRAVVYDCMDELSAFRFAPAELPHLEAELMRRADVFFTGGRSWFEAKRGRHANLICEPSGVDLAHFAQALANPLEPADQAAITGPKLGYFGVVDERLDYALIAASADAAPDLQFVMIGPLAKVSAADLPRRANLHWLGARSYESLPAYLAHWSVAMMPFALNEATRFISPTKAPEYLAGGVPVVSTPIADVVSRYRGLPCLRIAGDAPGFVAAARSLSADGRSAVASPSTAALLAEMSWNGIQSRMAGRVRAALPPRAAPPLLKRRPGFDVAVIGAGFAGSVMAERLADSGKRVLLVDRRPHIAGNAFDERDAAGLLVHRYGPHIFHTNSAEVFTYLSRFTEWRDYEHRVLAATAKGLLPVPINRTTLSGFFGVELEDAAAAEHLLAQKAEGDPRGPTAEDFVVAAVGHELYEAFFRGYTTKQWGVPPSALDRSVTARVPTRTSTDDRYFLDRYQAMPRHGYTRMFENMLDHRNIRLCLATEWQDVQRESPAELTVFTGPVDEFYGHRFGPLPYRSLRFVHATLPIEQLQPVATLNFPDAAIPFTRITEFKHLTGERASETSICVEYPAAEGDPYYPVPAPESAALYQRYQALADAEPDTLFLGRLGTYRYLNMDQVVGQALAAYRKRFAADRAVA